MSNPGTPGIVLAGFGSGADLVRRMARSGKCSGVMRIDHSSCVIAIGNRPDIQRQAPEMLGSGELPELLGSAAVVFMISDGMEWIRTSRLAARIAEANDLAVMIFLVADGDGGGPPEYRSLSRSNHDWFCGRGSAVVVDAPTEPDDAGLRLAKMVSCISNMLLEPSIINLDLADLRTVMRCGREACIISGTGLSPESALRDALEKSPGLLDMRRARGCLLHITGGTNLTLRDANHIAESMTGMIDPEANVIWGMRVRGDLERIEITAVLTGKNIMHGSRNAV
ncbi:MAG TPA: hypothetical protein PK659_05050 [Methanothrix sp.]|nr:hypothetical protein [Methanothrix sp.]HOK58281.1 hypothetical protein [Methanothrix sp.]HOL43605.1 hypothetical protein [Methanothrix sp.]HPO89080.1 hypothetical protein [Methanothrix sp.]